MSESSLLKSGAAKVRRKFFYGWVIVAVCAIAVAISYGTQYSYSVFFKPLVEYFGWDRSTVSSIYSIALIIRGAASIGIGWLADEYGSIRIMALCGFFIGLGLILSSQVTELWHLYLAYGLIEATGLGGAYAIGAAITSKWFAENRGFALGIIASGSGLGTLILVPGIERLISTFNWSVAFLVVGISAGLIIIGTAFLLKPAPSEQVGRKEAQNLFKVEKSAASMIRPATDLNRESFLQELLSKKMLLMFATFFLSVFGIHMILIHLVNFATDMGISALQSASFISIIGAVSIPGRLIMGRAADRIGVNSSLVLCMAINFIALVILLFSSSPLGFYLFAVIFGFAYGGEVPLMPMFVVHFFGTQAMAMRMGLLTFIFSIGGALGAWVGGIIYDTTSNYHYAFGIAIIASLGALAVSFVMRKVEANRK